jgi:hypothetical protein
VDGNGKSNVNPQDGESIICRDQLLRMAIDLTLEFLANFVARLLKGLKILIPNPLN